MKATVDVVVQLWMEENGLSTVEYAVAAGLISAVMVAAFQALGGTVGALIGNLNIALGG